MSKLGMRRRWTMWAGAATTAALVVIIVHGLLPPSPAGHGHSIWFGVGAAVLILVCSVLGLRKRWLRLRLGSVASWTVAHQTLGVLALVLALAHCQWTAGGMLTTALLACLSAVVVSGIAGTLIQLVVPKVMNRQLPHEASHDRFPVIFAEHWRRVHDIVEKACGAQPQVATALSEVEAKLGIDAPNAAGPTSERLIDETERETIASFYRSTVAAFLTAPRATHRLATAAGATLTFDAVRANVDRDFHPILQRIEDVCGEARVRFEERRFHRIFIGWQMFHIPLSTMLVVLTVIHGLTAIYY